jgi:hypothetical protein
MLLKMAEQRPGASSQLEFNRFRLGIEPESLFAFAFQKQFYCLGQIVETFFFRFPLPISAGDFEASGPKASLFGLSTMNNGC